MPRKKKSTPSRKKKSGALVRPLSCRKTRRRGKEEEICQLKRIRLGQSVLWK